MDDPPQQWLGFPAALLMCRHHRQQVRLFFSPVIAFLGLSTVIKFVDVTVVAFGVPSC